MFFIDPCPCDGKCYVEIDDRYVVTPSGDIAICVTHVHANGRNVMHFKTLKEKVERPELSEAMQQLEARYEAMQKLEAQNK